MKYKTMGLLVCLFGLLASLVVEHSLVGESKHYHQHRERPGYTPCSDHGDEVFCSHLPLVMIDTAGAEIPGLPLSSSGEVLGEDCGYEYGLHNVTMAPDGLSRIVCRVQVVDHPNSNNHPTDDPTIDSQAEIRIRGNTSRYLDKKGYLIHTTAEGDRNTNRDVKMLGMDPHHEWALHGPYRDKSLIRNYICYNLAGEIMPYAPDVRFCEVFINGEYEGVYLMMETISNGKHCRANLTPPRNNVNQVSYVIRVDRGSVNEIKNITSFTDYTLRNLNQKNIVYPSPSNLTPGRIEFIQNDLSAFEKALYSYDFDSPLYGWPAMIDLDSFVNYFLIHELTSNYEAGARSTYLYKDIRGRYGMVIWDFDGAFDNIPKQSFTEGFDLQNIIWFLMLCKDDHFVDRIVDQYWTLRENEFNEEAMGAYIDEVVTWLGPAIQREQARWGYNYESFRPLIPNSRNPENYEEAVQQLKDYLHDRLTWMDDNIDVLRQYCADSKIKKFIENAN